MHKNIGNGDRILRIIIGIILLAVILFVSNLYLKIFLGLLGIFSFYEALVGWCAFYALIGRNTCPIEI